MVIEKCCVCVCVGYFTADGVVEKVLSLNEFTEKLKMLSQHNSDVVREKVQQLTEKVSVNKT